MKSNKFKIVPILIFSALLFSGASTPASDADARFKKEKQTIYSMLKSHYAGFDMMVERGFTKQAWDQCSSYDDIRALFDFRSNGGGGNSQQNKFFNTLYKLNYKGTIYVTQDNWSYSSGEVWMIASRFTDKLSVKLIGTHSGGMQIYGNCVEYNKNGGVYELRYP